MNYEDFVIYIGPDRGGEYPVHVLESPLGRGTSTMRLPQSLGRRLIALGSILRLAAESIETARQIGQSLYSALFAGQVGELYTQSLRRVISRPDHGLRIKLEFDARISLLSQLPWELIYHAEPEEEYEPQKGYLSLSRLSPLVRYLDIGRSRQPVQLTLPLRVLVASANPGGDRESIDCTQRQRSSTAWGDHKLIEIDYLDHVSLPDLRLALLDGSYHVLHLAGHGGAVESENGEYALLIPDGNDIVPVTGSTLAVMLADVTPLRLVVLNACESAHDRSEGLGALAGIAHALVRGGLPAVLAMRFPISDPASLAFSKTFYRRLTSGDPVDLALVEGRKAIYVNNPSSSEWGAPVLLMRVPDGSIFRFSNIVRDPIDSKLQGPMQSLLESNERHDGLSGVVNHLRALLEEVKSFYPDAPRRELSWRSLKETSTGPLWVAAESLENDPYRRQLVDVLDAAVTKIEAFQLTDGHLSALDSTLSRLLAAAVTEDDVDSCEDEWRTAEVDTLPSLREAFEEWMASTHIGS